MTDERWERVRDLLSQCNCAEHVDAVAGLDALRREHEAALRVVEAAREYLRYLDGDELVPYGGDRRREAIRLALRDLDAVRAGEGER